jgi:hypothetical protein
MNVVPCRSEHERSARGWGVIQGARVHHVQRRRFLGARLGSLTHVLGWPPNSPSQRTCRARGGSIQRVRRASPWADRRRWLSTKSAALMIAYGHAGVIRPATGRCALCRRRRRPRLSSAGRPRGPSTGRAHRGRRPYTPITEITRPSCGGMLEHAGSRRDDVEDSRRSGAARDLDA